MGSVTLVKRNMNQYFVGNHNSEKAVAMIKNNQIIKTFNSATTASNETGIYRTNISRSCRNPKSKAGGYNWCYV